MVTLLPLSEMGFPLPMITSRPWWHQGVNGRPFWKKNARDGKLLAWRTAQFDLHGNPYLELPEGVR